MVGSSQLQGSGSVGSGVRTRFPARQLLTEPEPPARTKVVARVAHEICLDPVAGEIAVFCSTHVFAAGFAEAGVSLQSCRNCRTTLSHVLTERNGGGISLVDTGGHLAVHDSVSRWNVTGILLTSDPADVEQFGGCNLAVVIPGCDEGRCSAGCA